MVGPRLLHDGRKVTFETGISNSTKHKAKHVNPTAQNTKWNTWIQQNKTQSETRESNSTQYKVKHVNPTTQSETRESNSTKHKVKHMNSTAQNTKRNTEIQQHKTQSETRESNSTKHKVKHVNPAAQNTKWNTWIQQHKTQSETRESNSTQHKVKHANPFVIQPTQLLDKFQHMFKRNWNSLIIQFLFCAAGFTYFSLWLISLDSHAWRVCADGLWFALLDSHVSVCVVCCWIHMYQSVIRVVGFTSDTCLCRWVHTCHFLLCAAVCTRVPMKT